MAGEASPDNSSGGGGAGRSKVAAGLLGTVAVAALLSLAGFAFASAAVLSAAALPLLVLFSPVVAPAAGVIGAVVLAFGASGAAGLGGLWAVRWAFRRLKGRSGAGPGWADQVDRSSSDSEPGSNFTGPVGRVVTESGHVVSDRLREVRGNRQRVVQVKGA